MRNRGKDSIENHYASADGGIIPEKYSGRGNNVRPGFTFSNVPADTVSFAIIFHDVDVAMNGTDDVLHWIAWNIPAKAGGVPEGMLPDGTVSGTANVGRGNYFGPGAPSGPRYHHYVFELYALSKMLDLPADATRNQLLDAMRDVVVGKAAYVGRFRQQPRQPTTPPAACGSAGSSCASQRGQREQSDSFTSRSVLRTRTQTA